MTTTEPTEPTGAEPAEPAAPAGHRDPAGNARYEPFVPRPGAVAAWVGLLVAGLFLDGWAGAAPALVVGVVALARLPRRHLASTGVVALAFVPLTVLWQGASGRQNVHQDFVTRSFLPQHLTVTGFALLVVWVALDLRPAVRRPHHDLPAPAPGQRRAGAPWGLVPVAVRVGLVAVLTGALIAACVAVGRL